MIKTAKKTPAKAAPKPVLKAQPAKGKTAKAQPAKGKTAKAPPAKGQTAKAQPEKNKASKLTEPVYYSIQELTKLFDITPRTLRYYEEEGLLSPERIGTARRYTKKNKTRIMLILRGKRLGFSLEEIRRIFEFYDQTKSDYEQLIYFKDLIREKLNILEVQKNDILMAEEELKSMARQVNKHLKEKKSQTPKKPKP